MKTPIEALLDTVDWRESPPPLEDFGSRFLPDGLPRVTHFGEVDIMGFKLRCYRLTNGQTIFNAEDIHEFFGDNPHPGFDEAASA